MPALAQRQTVADMTVWSKYGRWLCAAMAMAACGQDPPAAATAGATDAAKSADTTGIGDGAHPDASTASADTAASGEAISGGDAAPSDAPATVDAQVSADAPASDGAAVAETAGGVCPQAAALLNVAAAVGAGDGYAKPVVAGTCANGKFTVTANGMPTYQFVPMTPNALKPQNHAWTVTTDPKPAAQTTAIPELGVVGFTVGGIPFYGPNEAGQPAAEAFGDPVYNGITDGCNGHTAQNGDYHQHALQVKCLSQAAVATKTPWTLPDEDGSKPSPIIGFSLDGFAIYGPWGCLDAACAKPVKFQSGYKKTGDPKTYAWKAYAYQAAAADPTVLDACNGRTGPDGVYRYHSTSGFPYILGCYRGSAQASGTGPDPGGGTGPQACTADADCTGAKCPAIAKAGCKCIQPPQEPAKICVPQCKSDADCPAPPGQTGKCTIATGTCQKPAGGGPPP